MNLDGKAPRRAGGCSAELVERLGEHHRHLTKAVTDLTQLLTDMAPRVIAQETVALGSDGTATGQCRLPFACLYVESQSAKVLIVAGMPMQSQAPAVGTGVAYVRAGGASVANIRAYVWSIWGGTAGDLVTVTAFSRPQAPYSR